MSVFKAYDVRGKYPTQIDEAFAHKLGAATVATLGARRLAIGRDVRNSAPSIAKAVCDGVRSAGATAVDFGLVTTPMTYYAVGRYNLDGGIMVTASHNPPGDIGFKICREQAFPVGQDTGLRKIQDSMDRASGDGRGGAETQSVLDDYRIHLRSFLKTPPRIRIAVDTANGSVGAHFDRMFGDLPGVEWVRLCFPPDGNFPNHEPNPLRDENVRDLQEATRKTSADLGVAFDGDGDRCMFFEKGGGRVSSDLITILLAVAEIRRNPGSAVVYDLRSSKVVPQEILRVGGVPIRERVGHAFIKATMRNRNAVLGGELSGHYYFRDHYFADSGMLAFAKVLDILGSRARPLGELLAPWRTTHTTGEINFRVEDKDAMLQTIRETFSDGRFDELDGITVEYDDWWFNVRLSNTEPLLRLNLEADTSERLIEARERLFEVLGTPV